MSTLDYKQIYLVITTHVLKSSECKEVIRERLYEEYRTPIGFTLLEHKLDACDGKVVCPLNV